LESGHEEAFHYLLKPVDYENLVAVIKEAYEKKMKIQDAKFQEQLKDLHRHGMGIRGMRNVIVELRKIYGFE